MKRILYSFLFLLVSTTSFAQKAKPELVSDICQAFPFCSGMPYLMDTYKGKLLFTANDHTSRNTAFHTYTRAEGVVGPYLYGADTSYTTYSYAILNDTVYFLGSLVVDGIYHLGLMKWDGTSVPKVINTNVNAIVSNEYIVALNNKIFYVRRDPTMAYDALWEYDPATGNDKMVLTKNEYILNITVMLGKIFMNTSMPGTSNYYILYTYDPQTGKVTEVLRDISYTTSLWKGGYVEIDNKAYFMVSDNIVGVQLYKYDGVNPPARLTVLPSMPFAMTMYLADGHNGKLYFPAQSANNQTDLWEYDTLQDKLRQLTFSTEIKRNLIQRPVFYNNKIIYDVYYIDSINTRGINVYDIATESEWRMPMPFDYSTYFTSYYGYVYENELYMSAETDSLGIELYRYSESPVSDSFTATLYPNPTTGIAHLNIETNTSQVFTLTILDVLGHTIMNKRLGIYPRGKHTIDIPLQHLASGVYICTLRGSKNILYRGKLVKL